MRRSGVWEGQRTAPVAEIGLPRILWASRHSDTDWAMAMLPAALILPMVQEPEAGDRAAAVGIASGGLLVVLRPILETGRQWNAQPPA